MLDDDIVLKNCYYWAKRMYCKDVDFNALVSVGYIVGKPLKDAKLLKDWIRFSMLKFIKDEHLHRNLCLNISPDNIQSIESKTFEEVDTNSHIERAKLSEREMQVIHQYFFLDRKQMTIAKNLRISQQTVNDYLKRGINKIRNTYCNDERN